MQNTAMDILGRNRDRPRWADGGNEIESISTGAIAAPAGATLINGNGRTLMPG